jgi:hypothetical protein
MTLSQLGFARLSQGIPANPLDLGYLGTMRELVNEVTNNADPCSFLTISEMGAAAAAAREHSCIPFGNTAQDLEP